MGTILAARPSLPSSHPLGRLSRDKRMENSGYRPRSHCPVTPSAQGCCSRKEPRAQSKGSADSSRLGAWGQGAAPSHWAPLQTEAPQATSSRGCFHFLFSSPKQDRPGLMSSWRWGGGWEDQKCCRPKGGPSGPGRKGLDSFLYSTLFLPPIPTLHE